MKQILSKFFSTILAVSMIFSLVSCASEVPQTTTAEEPQISTEPEVSTDITEETKEEIPQLPENMNPLTGLPCHESLVGKRPLAIMLNNLKPALPQSGLSKCDIIYEVLAEGGIIRLEGIILDYANAGQLGSVRSARPYYVQIAVAYDALYAHFGGSTEGDALIKRLNMDHMDGMAYDGKVINGIKTFYRDQNRINSGVSREHTAFVNAEGLAEIVKQKAFRTDLNNKEFTAFNFDPAFSGIENGINATYVKIPHSYYSVSEFIYDTSIEKYLHKQYDKAHIDGADGVQVSTENVFILFADEEVIDSEKHLAVDLIGEGSGYYLFGGKAQPITWKRAGETAEFRYYSADGNELKVAQGRSYISIVDTDTKASITIS